MVTKSYYVFTTIEPFFIVVNTQNGKLTQRLKWACWKQQLSMANKKHVYNFIDRIKYTNKKPVDIFI